MFEGTHVKNVESTIGRDLERALDMLLPAHID
jgi:hypothetical protein